MELKLKKLKHGGELRVNSLRSPRHQRNRRQQQSTASNWQANVATVSRRSPSGQQKPQKHQQPK